MAPRLPKPRSRHLDSQEPSGCRPGSFTPARRVLRRTLRRSAFLGRCLRRPGRVVPATGASRDQDGRQSDRHALDRMPPVHDPAFRGTLSREGERRSRNLTVTRANPGRETDRGSFQSQRILAVYSATRSPGPSVAASRPSGYTTKPPTNVSYSVLSSQISKNSGWPSRKGRGWSTPSSVLLKSRHCAARRPEAVAVPQDPPVLVRDDHVGVDRPAFGCQLERLDLDDLDQLARLRRRPGVRGSCGTRRCRPTPSAPPTAPGRTGGPGRDASGPGAA